MLQQPAGVEYMAEKKDASKKRDLVQGKATLSEGIELYKQKRWNLALVELLRVDPELFGQDDNMELAYYLGLTYTKLERYDEALLYLEQVVTSGHDALRACQCRMALAYIYLITKRYRMAEFELNRLSSKGFESAQLYSALAYAAWSQKQIKQAVDYYEKALVMDEDNANALNGLGYVLADSDIDTLRGLKCCRRAVDLKTDNPAYLDSLGWAYYKNGEIPEARTWIQRAIEAAPSQKEIKSHYRAVMGGK